MPEVPMIGRTKEISLLENLYASHALEIACVYGEEGIGVRTLIASFLRQKRGYFCNVRACSPLLNEAFFCNDMKGQGLTASPQETVKSLLERLFQKAEGEKIVFVVQRTEWLAAGFPSLFVEMAKLLGKPACTYRMLLLLTGKNRDSFQEPERLLPHQKLTYLPVGPLSYLEAMPVLANYAPEEKILLYGACGGQPSLLRLLRSDLSCKENVCSLLLNGNSSFADGAEAYLRMFLREPAVYQTILAAVAGGAARLQELEQRTGFSAGKLSKYLSTLVERGILARWIPATEMQIPKQHKKTLYKLENTFLLFHYLYIFPNQGILDAGGERKLFRSLRKTIQEKYCRLVFQQVCMQQFREVIREMEAGDGPTPVGYEWESGETDKPPLMVRLGKRLGVFGISIWQKNKVDLPEILEFMERTRIYSAEESYWIVYSRKGFTNPALRFSAHQPNLRLVSLIYMK